MNALASASSDKTIKIWNHYHQYDSILTRTLRGHFDSVTALVNLSNGDLASFAFQFIKQIRIFSTIDSGLKLSFRAHESVIYALAVLHNGDLASGSVDKTIKIWNPLDAVIY